MLNLCKALSSILSVTKESKREERRKGEGGAEENKRTLPERKKNRGVMVKWQRKGAKACQPARKLPLPLCLPGSTLKF